MMTRRKTKRIAEKDKSSPKKSKQKYSTILGSDDAVELGEMVMMDQSGTSGNNGVLELGEMVMMDQSGTSGNNGVLELGEMVTMDHGGTSGGLDVDCLQTDYRQVAWLLREKLKDLVEGDNGEFPESRLQSILDMAASSNIIFVDPKMLNPILWRTLPKELLVLVLARLPLPDITRLRSLSRDWKNELATANSAINQACDNASSSIMVAFLSHCSMDTFFVTIYDVTKSRWQYAYYLRLLGVIPSNHNDLDPCPHMWTPVDACDGGLMCFISLWKPTKNNRLRIVVVNLLTRVQHDLPLLYYQYSELPTMVQLKVDSHTKCYKVFVATYRAKASGLTIETYDSGEKKWTRAVLPSGSIFGTVFHWIIADGWSGSYKLSSWAPGAYDFGEGKLQLYTHFKPSVNGIQPPLGDWEEVDMVLGKDRMFNLLEHKQMDTSLGRRLHQSFHIIEYHLDNRTKVWVQEKSYKCPGFEDLEVVERSFVTINACDAFLMVIFHYDHRSTYFRLLDLSTGEWSNVPEIPKSEGLHTTLSKLCRAYWNVVP